MSSKILSYREFKTSGLESNYTSEAESRIQRQLNALPLSDVRYSLTKNRSTRGASLTARSYLEKMRSGFSADDDLFVSLTEMILVSRLLEKGDARRYTMKKLRDQFSEEELSEMVNVVEDGNTDGKISLSEGLANKAVLTGLYMRYRSRLSGKNQSIEDKFRILADLIGLVALFNHDSIRDVIRSLKK